MSKTKKFVITKELYDLIRMDFYNLPYHVIKYAGNGNLEIEIPVEYLSQLAKDIKSFIDKNEKDLSIDNAYNSYNLFLKVMDEFEKEIINKDNPITLSFNLKITKCDDLYLLTDTEQNQLMEMLPYMIQDNIKNHIDKPIKVKINDKDLLVYYSLT